MPLVSVVMPTLNSARYVREAVHSLIKQDYPRFELIVVDGGSTDGTLDILKPYLGDGDLKVIELPADLGIAKALNIGLAEARGEFIARMDADDVSNPSRLTDQVEFLAQNPDVRFVGAGIENFGARAGQILRPQSYNEIRDSFLTSNPFYHSTIMISRGMVDSGIFRYDENQACDEDYELWGRLIPKTVCANMQQYVLRYRLHDHNGHWDPRKYSAKCKALREFCQAYDIVDEPLICALAELQCTGFIRHNNYHVLRAYAERAADSDLPALGWIQEALTNRRSYLEFSQWFYKVQVESWSK